MSKQGGLKLRAKRTFKLEGRVKVPEENAPKIKYFGPLVWSSISLD